MAANTGVRSTGLFGARADAELPATKYFPPVFSARSRKPLAAGRGTRRPSLGVNSGTSGLICALVAAGVRPGDEVLVPAYTWVSSAAAALAVGAIPVLVEIDQSLTIDPAALVRKITARTKAVIPVHMLDIPDEELHLYAGLANAHHGRSLSRAERNRFVVRLAQTTLSIVLRVVCPW